MDKPSGAVAVFGAARAMDGSDNAAAASEPVTMNSRRSM